MPAARGSVEVDREGARATVTWSRPPLNVFDTALLDDLARALRTEPVRSAHVVVLEGADHRWSAGFAVEDHLPERVRPMFRAFHEVLRAIAEVPAPTLAAVKGPCLGGGLELLEACDLAFAARSATFGQPEVRLGVFPPLAAVTAPERLGPKRAADLLLLGETIGAEQALALGLVSRVAADEALDAEVRGATDRLSGFRRETLVLLKRAMRIRADLPWGPLVAAERLYVDGLLALPDADEGLRAFLEKRPAVWPAPGRA